MSSFAAPRIRSCTVFIYAKRYYDVERGKYIRDKMECIKSQSLGDILEDSTSLLASYRFANYHRPHLFVPKDNDFDFE